MFNCLFNSSKQCAEEMLARLVNKEMKIKLIFRFICFFNGIHSAMSEGDSVVILDCLEAERHGTCSGMAAPGTKATRKKSQLLTAAPFLQLKHRTGSPPYLTVLGEAE